MTALEKIKKIEDSLPRWDIDPKDGDKRWLIKAFRVMREIANDVDARWCQRESYNVQPELIDKEFEEKMSAQP